MLDTAPVRGEIPDIEPEQIHLAIKESGVLEQNTDVAEGFYSRQRSVCENQERRD